MPEATPTATPTATPEPTPTLTATEAQCREERDYLAALAENVGEAVRHMEEIGQLMVVAGDDMVLEGEASLIRDYRWQEMWTTAFLGAINGINIALDPEPPDSLLPLHDAVWEWGVATQDLVYRLDAAVSATGLGNAEQAGIIMDDAEEMLRQAEPLGHTVANMLAEALAVDRSEC